MVLNLQAVGQRFVGEPRTWTSKDTLLYAIGVGAGAADPSRELEFTTENSAGATQAVLPTFVTVLTTPVPWELLGDFPRSSILHGEQAITLHQQIPVSGTATASTVIESIEDAGRHAVVRAMTELRDSETDTLMAELHRTVVLRGQGGFGGSSTAQPSWSAPQREPDAVVRQATRPDQALLYRLNGDRNPLHSDPAFAAEAGFDRPILHGLCTFGFAGRAILHAVCNSDPAAFGSMTARFSAPVAPGAELVTSCWFEGDAVLFQTRAGNVVVLDRGVFRFRP